jgi:hypothetical protein
MNLEAKLQEISNDIKSGSYNGIQYLKKLPDDDFGNISRDDFIELIVRAMFMRKVTVQTQKRTECLKDFVFNVMFLTISVMLINRLLP